MSATRKTILAELKKLKEIEAANKGKAADDPVTVWVEPALVCEVQYRFESVYRPVARTCFSENAPGCAARGLPGGGS